MMNARVNEKLYFARLVLDAARQGGGTAKIAVLEAALLHLITAYRAYLYEIALYELAEDDGQTAAIYNAQDAGLQRERLGLARKPELDELIQLEQSDAWPAQLLAAYMDVIATVAPSRVPLSDIALADVTGIVDEDNCARWLDQFQQLLQRQREHAREW